MAIAFDAKTHQTDGGGAQSSRTISHTTSGSNRFLIVFVEGSNVADRITGVTYAGVSMTKSKVFQGDTGRFLYCYTLANPASGANNVVISSSPSDIIGASIISFTGVNQSSTPDSTNTGTTATGTSLSLGTTVVASNCWIVAFIHGQTNYTVFSGGNARSETSADGYLSADSNATVGTGSQSIVFQWSPSGVSSGITISIAPAVASTADSTPPLSQPTSHWFPQIISL